MDGWVTIGTKLDTKDFDKQIEEVKAKIEELEEVTSKGKELGFSGEQIRKAEIDLEKLKNKYVDLQKKQIELSKTNVFGNISKSMTDIIKKVAKWSLAIVGIRSIYLGIRQAMSTLTSYDDKLKANVDYMRFAMANALKPVIEWILNAMYQILGLVARIIYLISGYNIFEKSGIKDYQKAMKSSVGSAKELKKTLAGFDEMNVLSQTSSGGGAGGTVTNPDMPDLSELATLPSVVDEINEKVLGLGFSFQTVGQEMKEALANPKVFDEAYGYWGTFVKGVVKLFYGIYEIIKGLSEVVAGVVLIIGGLFTGNFEAIKLGWEMLKQAIVDIVMGIHHTVVGILEMLWGFIKGIIGTILDMFIAFGKGVIQAFKDALSAVKNTWIIAKDWFNSSVIQPLLDKWNTFKTKLINVFTNIKTKATDIFGSIKTFIVDKVINPIKTKFEQLGEGIKNIFTGVGNFMKGIVNIFIDAMNLIIRGLNKLSIDVPKWVPKYGGKKWGFNLTELPRLARGGIVNNPGPGVMMGSYIAGERGPEAVMPLDDATMDRLGEAIARHMTINANITNNMNGRVISRELQKINAENTFAFNS